MERYDYEYEIELDIKDYIEQEINLKDYTREDLEEKLNEDLWCYDGVTGNASGSYYCNAWRAEEAISHNWDLLEEALEEFGQSDINPIEKGAEWCDVTIRCYLLSRCISEVLNNIDDEDFKQEDEDEE